MFLSAFFFVYLVAIVSWKALEGTRDRIVQIKRGLYDTAPFDSSTLLPAFVNFTERFRISPEYHLLKCKINKVMSTVSDAIFCYLKNSTEFIAHGRKISTEKFSTRFCRWNGARYCSLQTARKVIGRSRIEFAVVRDPIERFISGFVDKCLHENQCYSCDGDMGCFVSKLSTSLFRYYRGEDRSSNFHLDHFAPQNWHCNFRYSLNDFRIIKYESGREGAVKLAKEFRTIFRKAGVPTEMRNTIYNEMSIGRSHHSTYGLEERQVAERTLMSNFTLLASVLRLFYYDYVIFGFKLPDVFRNHSTFS